MNTNTGQKALVAMLLLASASVAFNEAHGRGFARRLFRGGRRFCCSAPQMTTAQVRSDFSGEQGSSEADLDRVRRAQVEYSRIIRAYAPGKTKAQLIEAVGCPSTCQVTYGDFIYESWVYDIDDHVYASFSFDSNGRIIGMGGCGGKCLEEELRR